MTSAKRKQEARNRRRVRVRAKVSGTAERPRLSVFRSAKHLYAQLVDDAAGKTLVSARDAEIKKAGLNDAEGLSGKTAAAFAVGKLLAEKAKKSGLAKAVFDRGGYAYHGRVKAVADGARSGGLEF